MRRENEHLLYIALAVSAGLHVAVWFFASYSDIKKDEKFLSIPVEISFYTPLPARAEAPPVVEQKETIKQEEPKAEQPPVTKEDVVVKKKEKPKPKQKQKKAKPEEKQKKEEVKEPLSSVETVQPAQTAEQRPEAAGSQYESLSFDTQDFNFPYYAKQIRGKIEKYWHWADSYGALRAVIYFKISKDGSLTDAAVKESSGDSSFDNNALRAVRLSSPFSPLPVGYTEDFLGVHFEFKYR